MNIKFIKLYKVAKRIDESDKVLNKNKVLELLKDFKPKYIGRGGYKRAFLVKLNKRKLIFKIGKDIEIQYKIYLERKYKQKLKYAKIYWITKKCLLQRYCERVKVPKSIIKKNKIIAKIKGYSDWRAANVGMHNNEIIAFDLQTKEHEQKLKTTSNQLESYIQT